jgi:DNA polymerase-3 subunit epsilon
VQLTEEDAHGAAADALAAGRLAWRLATQPDRFAQFDGPRGVERINPAQWPLDRLHTWQAETKRAQADSFAAYLTRQGKPDDVSRSWPIQEPPPGWAPEQLPEPAEEPERKTA